MGEDTPIKQNSAKIPKKPLWIKDFDNRAALAKVISEAFNPNCDPEKIVRDLRKAATAMDKDFQAERPKTIIPKG